MRHQESKIQIVCVNWFKYQYPSLGPIFFSVPNGGKRNLTEAKILKAEGAKAGVSDLLLLHPNEECNFLAIEMKTKTGSQSKNQKDWQKGIENLGGKYQICRSVEEFQETINLYLKNTRFGKKIIK